MIRIVFTSVCFLILHFSAAAQPKNNYCQSAITLSDVTSWCSAPAQYSTNYATPGNIDPAGCFYGLGDEMNDVWFKFRAIGNTVNVSVIGKIAKNPKGTLEFPQMAIYEGSCSELMTEVGCYSDSRGYNLAETFAQLTAGQTYYIRVDGKYNKTGTFQLCVNNYNAVPDPNGDCSDAVVLCDNSAFTVPKVVGYGRYKDPIGVTCLEDGESSSVWYKWTCDESGTLAFKLKPINPTDDLDFALFLLPNGIEDCSEKIPLRCMASGENQGSPLMTWIRCTGTTGLRESSFDFTELQGCNPTDDNFLAALRMEKGQSFALLINNFSNTGNGFSLEFGGTGKMAGPKPYFKVSKLKLPVDSLLTVWNVSKFEGGKIIKYEWDFGVGATPKTYSGWKPPKVRYKSTGKKSISLTVETDRGCTVTKIRNLTIIKNPPKPPKPKEEPQVVAANLKEEKKTPKVNKIPSEETEFQANTGNKIINTKPKPIVDLTKKNKPPKSPKKDTAIVYYDVLHVYKLYFDADSFNLKTDHLPFVNEAVQWLDKHPKNMLHVEGHTNGIPRDEYCNKLAQKRANSALNYLKNKGVPENKLVEKIYGKTRPQAPNKSLVGRKRNQRVEIKVLRPEE